MGALINSPKLILSMNVLEEGTVALKGMVNEKQNCHLLSPSHPTGVDVWRPHGGHPLLQGGPYLQEIRTLQSSRGSQPGPGKTVAPWMGTGRGARLISRAEASRSTWELELR